MAQATTRRPLWERASWPGRALAVLSLAALLSVSRPVRADVQTELEKGRAAYIAKNYAEAESHLRKVIDGAKSADPRLLSLARMYLGAVRLAERQREEATQLFEKLLLDDQLYEPDPLAFPADVINLFIDTRAQLRERLNAAAQERARLEAERRAREEAERRVREQWLVRVQEMASEEKITVRGSRGIAMVPFGVGQFQNGQEVLGAFFLGLESALVLGSAATIPFYVSAQDSASEEWKSGNPEQKAQAYRDRAANIRLLNLSLGGAFLATALIGVIQAQWSFVPERVEIKRRPLPALPIGPRTARAPILQPTLPDGGGGGVRPFFQPSFLPEGRGGGVVMGVEGRF